MVLWFCGFDDVVVFVTKEREVKKLIDKKKKGKLLAKLRTVPFNQAHWALHIARFAIEIVLEAIVIIGTRLDCTFFS